MCSSGELVGYSALSVSRENPGAAYEWDTLVVRPPRTPTCGLLMITTMRLLGAGACATKKISTFHSVLNGPMIAVNEALGAHVAGGMVALRKVL